MESSPALQQLLEEDAVGQLRRCEGLMATLGSEDGIPKLDWVEGLVRLLNDPTKLEELETEARAIWQRGIRHIIWAGMGGSVIAVRVLIDLGFCTGSDGQGIVIYPLDSTDPAALNAIVRKIASAKNIALPTVPTGQTPPDPAFLHALLHDVMLIGVSMGMTSEEPITHLTWFADLLAQAQLQPQQHLLVMTLPASYLDHFAQDHQVPTRPLQLDGRTGTGGRMSAPTTRVFLLPVALYLASLSHKAGTLRSLLRQAWTEHNLSLATTHPAEHPFVRLAAALSEASRDGACRMLLNMPGEWQALIPWIEQLMEESLGKGGKGVVVFSAQSLNQRTSTRVPTPPNPTPAPTGPGSGTLHICALTGTSSTVVNEQKQEENTYILYQPYCASTEPLQRLAAVATSFLGWQLTMALYGYLQRITFAGQPAVENYKARARTLRTQPDPLQITHNWSSATTQGPLTLLAPPHIEAHGSPASVFAGVLQQFITVSDENTRLDYLDLTINGELPASSLSSIDTHLHKIGNQLLGVPVKLRQAPAAYHSTEQSEMGGPPYLVSLRILMRTHEESILGSYTDTFLCAQAVSTWQAMIENGRLCFLLLIAGSPEVALAPLERFFQDVVTYLLKHIP